MDVVQLVADVVLLELPQPGAHGRQRQLGARLPKLGAHGQLGAVLFFSGVGLGVGLCQTGRDTSFLWECHNTIFQNKININAVWLSHRNKESLLFFFQEMSGGKIFAWVYCVNWGGRGGG